jgi:hypothetical protein
MATLLDLPRELFLLVCDQLPVLDLASLSQCSRMHYLATQESMYSKIALKTYNALVKLTWTMMRTPVVSLLTTKYV